jgi:hypothetical protein
MARAGLFLALAGLLAAAGCAPPDPEYERLNAMSLQQARAMVGREYISVAPERICQDPSAVYGAGNSPGCRFTAAVRFTVEEVVLLRNDTRPILRIAGTEAAGYIAYGVLLAKSYKPVEEYFGTGRR